MRASAAKRAPFLRLAFRGSIARMKYAAILLALAIPAAAQAQGARPCPGFEGSRASLTDVDRFYGLRAVEILRAGMADDQARLAALVAPKATAGFWSGDSKWGARGADRSVLTGIDAIVALANRLKPRSFSATLSMPGPISVDATPCAWEAMVLVAISEPGRAVSLKFAFEDGMLVAVSGDEVGLIEGTLP